MTARWAELYDRAFPQVYRALAAATLASAPSTASTTHSRVVLLTERQRAIVVAHYYLGLSQEEIAKALGIRRGTVSVTVSHSLARIRREKPRMVNKGKDLTSLFVRDLDDIPLPPRDKRRPAPRKEPVS